MSDFVKLGDVARALEDASKLEQDLMLASAPGHAEGEPFLLLAHFREEIGDMRRMLARKLDEWQRSRTNIVSR